MSKRAASSPDHSLLSCDPPSRASVADPFGWDTFRHQRGLSPSKIAKYAKYAKTEAAESKPQLPLDDVSPPLLRRKPLLSRACAANVSPASSASLLRSFLP